MTQLHIALNDGFAGDQVAVRVDGREVYRKAGVKTDLRISRADAVDTEAADGGADVEIEARGKVSRVRVDPKATPYLGVDLGPDGQPRFRQQAEPFAYL
jgi:hypothetical protein